jgi:hypothetical protein
MQNQDAGNIAVAPELRGHCHVQFGRVQIRQIVKAEGCGGWACLNNSGYAKRTKCATWRYALDSRHSAAAHQLAALIPGSCLGRPLADIHP